jgi:hypothetical protein
MNQSTQSRRHTLSSSAPHPFLKWFADIAIGDIPLVSGKNASLGEMVRELIGKGVKAPDGFPITTEAYRHFIRVVRLDEGIRTTLSDLETHEIADFNRRGEAVATSYSHRDGAMGPGTADWRSVSPLAGRPPTPAEQQG